MVASRESISRQLDRLEERLPPLPASSLRFQRRLVTDVGSSMKHLLDAWREALRVSGDSTSTVIRQWLETRRQPAGPPPTPSPAAPPAGGRQPPEERPGPAVTGAGEEPRPVEPVAGDAPRPASTDYEADYEQMTKAELYRAAQEREIAGRSKMSKPELIVAIRADDERRGGRR